MSSERHLRFKLQLWLSRTGWLRVSISVSLANCSSTQYSCCFCTCCWYNRSFTHEITNKILTLSPQKTNTSINIVIIGTVFILSRFQCSQQLTSLTICSQGKTSESQLQCILQCFVPPSGQLGGNVSLRSCVIQLSHTNAIRVKGERTDNCGGS